MAGGIGDVRRLKRSSGDQPPTNPNLASRPAAPRLGAGPLWGPHPAVLHLDVDAFFAAVEQLRNPRLRGRPVVVGSGVVASASYEARAYGIRAGMPLAEACRRCPAAVRLPGHAPTYRAFAEQIFTLAAELSPAIETFLDDALIDLSGTEGVHGHLIRAADRLRRRIVRDTGLSVSLGMATNRMVARMVTRRAKPGGFAWLRPGGEAAFVAGRPVGELPGIGPRRCALLREMGIERVAELGELSPVHLRDLFGEVGLVIAARARGHETRAVDPGELPRSIRRETSFDRPAAGGGDLVAMLHYLTERAAGEGRRLGITPRRLRVHLRWADGQGASRSAALAPAACSTEIIFRRARELHGALLTRRMGLRNLGIELAQFELPDAAQLTLLDGPAVPAGAGPQFDDTVDAIRRRFGFRSLVRGPSLELLDQLPSDAYGFVLRTPCLNR